MFSKKHGFVFVHIPKNAGTSVTAALNTRFGKLSRPEKLVNSVAKRLSGKKIITPVQKLKDHATAAEYLVHLGTQYWQMYSFAFVRNPLDRAVSLYHYIQQTPVHYQHDKVRDFSFEEFLAFIASDQKSAMPQTSFLLNEDGECLVKQVGRVETLDDDFLIACRHLCPDLGVEHVNRSKRKHVSDYYGPGLTDILIRTYQQDFDAFGYSTDVATHETGSMKLKMYPMLGL